MTIILCKILGQTFHCGRFFYMKIYTIIIEQFDFLLINIDIVLKRFKLTISFYGIQICITPFCSVQKLIFVKSKLYHFPGCMRAQISCKQVYVINNSLIKRLKFLHYLIWNFNILLCWYFSFIIQITLSNKLKIHIDDILMTIFNFAIFR